MSVRESLISPLPCPHSVTHTHPSCVRVECVTWSRCHMSSNWGCELWHVLLHFGRIFSVLMQQALAVLVRDLQGKRQDVDSVCLLLSWCITQILRESLSRNRLYVWILPDSKTIYKNPLDNNSTIVPSQNNIRAARRVKCITAEFRI